MLIPYPEHLELPAIERLVRRVANSECWCDGRSHNPHPSRFLRQWKELRCPRALRDRRRVFGQVDPMLAVRQLCEL